MKSSGVYLLSVGVDAFVRRIKDEFFISLWQDSTSMTQNEMDIVKLCSQ